MCQLVFDEVRAKVHHFIEEDSGHGSETMPAHFLFADFHSRHGGKYGVVAHEFITPRVSCIGENIAAISSQGVWLSPDVYSLSGKGDNVLGINFGYCVTPLGWIQVNIFPLRVAQVAGAHKNYRCRAAQRTGSVPFRKRRIISALVV